MRTEYWTALGDCETECEKLELEASFGGVNGEVREFVVYHRGELRVHQCSLERVISVSSVSIEYPSSVIRVHPAVFECTHPSDSC